MEDKKYTLQDTMAKIHEGQAAILEELRKEKKVKGFRIPWRGKVGRGKIKKGWVSIIYLQENKGVKIIRCPISEQIVDIDGVPHYVSPKHILNYKNKPMIILPSWSEEPFSVEDSIEKSQSSIGWKYIMNYLEKSKITEKKKTFGAMAWILGIGLIIGVGYYLIKSGAFT